MIRRFTTAISLTLILTLGCGEKMTEEQLRAQARDYEEKEQWEEAVKTYEQLAKQHPESEKADEDLYNLGVIHANNLKNFYRAVEAYKELTAKYPKSSHVIKANFMIGYLYANDIKDLDRAREVYEKFLQDYPDHELAVSVRWELDHLGQDISDIELQLDNSAESN